MRKTWLVALGIAVLSGAAHAQVLAQVGGVSITRAQVIAANPAAKNDARVRNQVLVTLINRQAVLNEARKVGIEKTSDYRRAVREQEENVAINMMAERFAKAHPITDKQIEADYRRIFDKTLPLEYRLREILVESFVSAKEVMEVLRHGKSFSILAAEKSQDQATAALGGETGWQVATRLAAPILKTVKAMKVKEVAGPISTPHGFVVVQLLGKRRTPKPPLDQVKPRIEEAARQQAWIDHIIKLRTEQGAHLIVPLPQK